MTSGKLATVVTVPNSVPTIPFKAISALLQFHIVYPCNTIRFSSNSTSCRAPVNILCELCPLYISRCCMERAVMVSITNYGITSIDELLSFSNTYPEVCL